MELMNALDCGMPLGVPVTTNREIRQEVCYLLPSLFFHYLFLSFFKLAGLACQFFQQ